MTVRLALLAALLLTGCVTTVLPGRTHCYQITYFVPINWFHALADAVDGWRCEGKKDGDEALPDNK